jgi:hypothetical protein
MKVLARGLMLKKWVREQLQLIKYMVDKTELRFSKVRDTTKYMIVED